MIKVTGVGPFEKVACPSAKRLFSLNLIILPHQLEQTIVMPNSMTLELVPENERKKRPSTFGSFKEQNSAPVVVSLPVSLP